MKKSETDPRDVFRVVDNRAARRRKKHRPREKTQPPWTASDWNATTAPAAKVIPANKDS